MNNYKKKILLTGGGSGGHVMPLLLVAKCLSNEADLIYVGTNGIESGLVKEAGIKFYTIKAGKIRRYVTVGSLWMNCIDIFNNLAGFIKAVKIIKSYNPDVILAKGGYVSLPVILAGAMLGKRIYVHESDVVAGVANKIASRFAHKIFVSFPPENYQFPKDKLIYSGLPVNESLFKERSKEDYNFFELSPAKKTILVTGGSQGAECINKLIVRNINELLKKYQVIHLCGRRSFDLICQVDKNLKENSQNYKVFGFLDDMPKALRLADLVISRASSTIFEIFAAGKPSILIPLKNAASNHQLKNALFAEKAGASKIFQEGEINSSNFMEILDNIMDNENVLEKMSKMARALSKSDSVKIITEELLK